MQMVINFSIIYAVFQWGCPEIIQKHKIACLWLELIIFRDE